MFVVAGKYHTIMMCYMIVFLRLIRLHEFSLVWWSRYSSSSNMPSVRYCFAWHNRPMYTRRRRDAKCDLLRVFNDVPWSLYLPMRSFRDVVSREKKWRGKRSPIPLYWRWKVGFSRQARIHYSRVYHTSAVLCTAAFGGHGSAVLASCRHFSQHTPGLVLMVGFMWVALCLVMLTVIHFRYGSAWFLQHFVGHCYSSMIL